MLSSYSIPREAEELLHRGILQDPRQQGLPREIFAHAKQIRFTGTSLPTIAINWRFAESMAALKGFEAAMLGVLLERKYQSSPLTTTINTDHCQLLFMSSLVLTVQPKPHFEVNPTPVRELSAKYAEHFPTQDPYQFASTFHRRAATNIYRTADDKFIHIHGSLNPDPTIAALGQPWDRPEITTREASYDAYTAAVAQHTAADLETLLNDVHHQACTTVHTAAAYAATPHGQANAHTNLYTLTHHPSPTQPPSFWPPSPQTSPARPLAGLKVVDLTRVIAGPSATRGLAELGASVMRVTAPHLPDFTGLHPDLNWGKWNCHLDLREGPDLERLKALIRAADVVVDGYRPGVFEKFGLGRDGVLGLCAGRGRGVVYARENSYGWEGEWRGRSGWQPISDANTGISYGFGRAMGRDEPCTPVFPNSDYCTGIAGCTGILQALIAQSERGGSFTVDFSLNYYNTWLATVCGEYPDEVWQDVWSRNGRQTFRHYESMNVTVPAYLKMLQEHGADTLFRPEFFERRTSKCLGLEMQVVRPGIGFPPGTVELGFNVGTRGNGVDKAHWPDDLMTETVG